ncbi:TetR/AcrR family transcriptional regulator [Ilumatobacteraceae bacterium]|nr:TetR/AcrR family transcriptional regulator [Ilumatobacteraceae bacterium]
MAEPTNAPPPRQKSRAETMQLLRTATLELLETVNPQDLTIREIADRAGVFHRYVPDYFGGKAELFADIYPTVQAQAAAGVAPLDGDTFRPEIIRFAQLAIWLSQHRDNGLPGGKRSIVDQLVSMFMTDMNLDATTALLLAQRQIAGVITIAAFPDVVSDEAIDIAAHRELEIRVLRLLVQEAATHNTPDEP